MAIFARIGARRARRASSIQRHAPCCGDARRSSPLAALIPNRRRQQSYGPHSRLVAVRADRSRAAARGDGDARRCRACGGAGVRVRASRRALGVRTATCRGACDRGCGRASAAALWQLAWRRLRRLVHTQIGRWTSRQVTRELPGGCWRSASQSGWQPAQTFHEPIAIQPRGRAILQANCVECHAGLTHEMASDPRGQLDCVHCHADVGHGERAGLGGPLRYPSLTAQPLPATVRGK
jgi:hypothetical protein